MKIKQYKFLSKRDIPKKKLVMYKLMGCKYKSNDYEHDWHFKGDIWDDTLKLIGKEHECLICGYSFIEKFK